MFEAYDKVTGQSVAAHDVMDISKIYYCPICDAELRVRGINTKITPHFYNFPNAKKHLRTCPYSYLSLDQYRADNVTPFDVQAIYDELIGLAPSSTSSRQSSLANPSYPPSQKVFVNSAKGILKFCLANQLSARVNDATVVSDIFIDHRNIQKHRNRISGLKMLLGTTVRYESEKYESSAIPYLVLRIESKTTRTSREIHIYMSDTQLAEIRSYVFNNNEERKFSGFPVSVFAIWSTDEGKVKTTIQVPNQIIYKGIAKKHVTT